ncbi:MAG: M23 family metallopeptidase [Clostridia bacterium]|nr:M23 family metallopeptidase [Clostridia bacterium]
MWEKFKESNFAKKCKELSRRRGVVAVSLCLVLALAVVLSVSIATNRAKKKYAVESGDTGNQQTEAVTDSNNNEIVNGTIDAPTHNEESEAPVGAEPEVFELALPVSGSISKGHDATLQVWSDTMGDYRVHLGVDIATEEGAPVFAAADGVVAKIWDDALMGRCIAVSHGDEIFTFYKNLDPVLSAGIEEDAEIKCGQQLGRVGESAIAELADEPHLHIEMTVNGLAVDPTDYFSEEAKLTLSRDTSYESSAVTEAATEVIAEK